MPEPEEEKTSKKSISMPDSLWDFLDQCAAQTTQKNRSKMLQLLVEKEQRDRSMRYTWSDYSVHLVEEPGSSYQTRVSDEMKQQGITQPPAASTENPAPPHTSTPTPPGATPTEGH